MPKYQLETRRITDYLVEIEADSLEEAEAEVREWIADDFEEYITNQEWQDGEWEELEPTLYEYKIGKPFKGYEYTTVNATSFEEALELASAYFTNWTYEPETHEDIDENPVVWVRNLYTLEDRTY